MLIYYESPGAAAVRWMCLHSPAYRSLPREVKSGEAVMRLRESRQLIRDTVQMNEVAVAAQIERVHAEMTDPLHYNNEQSLHDSSLDEK